MLHVRLLASPDGPPDESYYYFASFCHTNTTCYDGIGCGAAGDVRQVESHRLLVATANLLEILEVLI